MPNLESTFVNSEIAQHGLGLECKQHLMELVGIEVPGPTYRLYRIAAATVEAFEERKRAAAA